MYYVHSNNIRKLFSFHFLIMYCAKGESRWKKIDWIIFSVVFLRDTNHHLAHSSIAICTTYVHILKSSLLFYICSLYEQSKGGTFRRELGSFPPKVPFWGDGKSEWWVLFFTLSNIFTHKNVYKKLNCIH